MADADNAANILDALGAEQFEYNTVRRNAVLDDAFSAFSDEMKSVLPTAPAPAPAPAPKRNSVRFAQPTRPVSMGGIHLGGGIVTAGESESRPSVEALSPAPVRSSTGAPVHTTVAYTAVAPPELPKFSSFDAPPSADASDESRSQTSTLSFSNSTEPMYRFVKKGKPPIRLFREAELREQTALGQVWIVIDNKVYNITSCYQKLPCGRELLLMQAGNDATSPFTNFHKHSKKAHKMLEKYVQGELWDGVEETTRSSSPPPSSPPVPPASSVLESPPVQRPSSKRASVSLSRRLSGGGILSNSGSSSSSGSGSGSVGDSAAVGRSEGGGALFGKFMRKRGNTTTE